MCLLFLPSEADENRTLPVKGAFKTNILEDDLEEIPVVDGMIWISCKPFEIVTLRLQL